MLWGLRAVSQEVAWWRRHALVIPDGLLRTDALTAISRKRANIDGAALFWILPRYRNTNLLRLLVAYEILADYLDCVSEREASVGVNNGIQLHRALVEALDPDLEVSDYYHHSRQRDDGGYLLALVVTCREAGALLPSYESVKPMAIYAASLAQVALTLNHEPDPARRQVALKQWAGRQFPESTDLTWWELTGAASAWLTILALLALAADRSCKMHYILDTYAAYLPWVSLSGTMLDSYSDIVEDIRFEAHSYIAHYPSHDAAVRRVCDLLHKSAHQVRLLPNSRKHSVILASMAAMYLSKDSTRTPEQISATRRIVQCSGSLTRLLLPVLWAWRVIYRQRSA